MKSAIELMPSMLLVAECAPPALVLLIRSTPSHKSDFCFGLFGNGKRMMTFAALFCLLISILDLGQPAQVPSLSLLRSTALSILSSGSSGMAFSSIDLNRGRDLLIGI